MAIAAPLDQQQAASLFDHLSARISPQEGCDHTTLTHCFRWAVANNLQWPRLNAWLRENGGHCDCEAIMNVLLPMLPEDEAIPTPSAGASSDAPVGSLPPTAETAGAGNPIAHALDNPRPAPSRDFVAEMEAQDKSTALAAAHNASTALQELLRFTREGADSVSAAFADETVAQLADALQMAITIERPRRADAGDKAGADLLGEMAAACAHFLCEWM